MTTTAMIDVDPDDRPVVRPLTPGVAVRVTGELGASSLLFRNLNDTRAWASDLVAQLDRLAAIDEHTDQAHALADLDDHRHAEVA